jgi:hypothetical protein
VTEHMSRHTGADDLKEAQDGGKGIARATWVGCEQVKRQQLRVRHACMWNQNRQEHGV